MENLPIPDAPTGGAVGTAMAPQSKGVPQPPAVQQLPAQMFTTAAQLLDLTDKKLVVVLRDGRKLTGVLRSWDQFANLVLQETVERIFVNKVYADISRGIFLIRGENVLLLGEVDLDKDDYVPEPFTSAPVEQVLALQKKEQERKKKSLKAKVSKLQTLGFEGEASTDMMF
ncbi:MAG: SM-like, degradation of cytoplasmic mRNAs and positively regulates transcription initiation [Vezdaea aestivalis]|nr:MAG: SM-like, degradation of cytoplasmic mRNAs and positively regulates transcription initiation [Vezdaea aestivalis]